MLEGNPLEYFAVWTRELRKRMGLSQHQFGQAMGVHSATVGTWERGENYLADGLSRKMDALGARFQMPKLPERPENYHKGQSAYFDPETSVRFAELFGE